VDVKDESLIAVKILLVKLLWYLNISNCFLTDDYGFDLAESLCSGIHICVIYIRENCIFSTLFGELLEILPYSEIVMELRLA
jgi:hypothetical protein